MCIKITKDLKHAEVNRDRKKQNRQTHPKIEKMMEIEIIKTTTTQNGADRQRWREIGTAMRKKKQEQRW